MATINLGSIKFNWKGAYNNSTAYAVDDVVSSGGNSYVCIQASQGNAVGNATAYWNIMSAAGTNGSNGTDLSSLLSTRGDLVFKNASALARLAKGTAGQVLGQGANDPAWVNGSSSTLTTQGDILYRDGSGLQRLAKGTAAQTLQMNSSANAPTWTTVAAASADFVKIASINQTTSVANAAQFNGCFTSAYDFYEIRGRMVIDGSYPRFQAVDLSNNLLTGSSYKWTYGGSQVNSGSTGNSQNAGTIGGDANILLNTWNTENADKPKDFIIRVTNPQTRVGNERPFIQWEAYGHASSNEMQHVQGCGYYNTNSRWGGFKVYAQSGNATWYVNVYGLKS